MVTCSQSTSWSCSPATNAAKTEVGQVPPPSKIDRTITIEEVEKAGEQFANNFLANFGLSVEGIEKWAAKLPKGDGEFKSKPKF